FAALGPILLSQVVRSRIRRRGGVTAGPGDQGTVVMAIVLPQATFLHIPKCGGTWVVRAMAAAGLPMQVIPAGCQHAIAATEGRFVFTFVRHPLTWYASFWKYRWNSAEQLAGSLEEQLQEIARR